VDAPGGAVCAQVNLALDLFLGLAAGRTTAVGKGISSKIWIVSGRPTDDSECLIFIALVGSAVLIVAVLTVVVVWPALAPWL
jgi:hypothetical protein